MRFPRCAFHVESNFAASVTTFCFINQMRSISSCTQGVSHSLSLPSHEVYGHICVIKTQKSASEIPIVEWEKIAGALNRRYPPVRTILLKSGQIDPNSLGRNLDESILKAVAIGSGERDLFPDVSRLDLSARESLYSSTVVENGLKFKVDLLRAWFSTRMAAERKRIADFILDSSLSEGSSCPKVAVLCSGVGPLACLLAKRGASVVAVEQNQEAVALAKENMILNKVSYELIHAKVQELPSSVLSSSYPVSFDFVVIPRPKGISRGEALSLLRQCISLRPRMLFWYDFTRAGEVPWVETLLSAVKEEARKKHSCDWPPVIIDELRYSIVETVRCNRREVAPGEFRTCTQVQFSF